LYFIPKLGIIFMMKAEILAKRRHLSRLVRKGAKASAVPTLLEQFAKFDGMVNEAPPDLALNHDHYRLGVPKRHGQ
jgi:hypothetical protein